MVSAPETDPRDGLSIATSNDYSSKLPSAKQLIAAATSPRTRDLPDAGRRADAGLSPKSQVDSRDALPPPSYRRDHVVPINSPQTNGGPRSVNGMHHPSTLAPGPAHSQADMEAAQRARTEAHYYGLVDVHTRDINNLGDILAQIEHNVQGLLRDMHIVRQELHNRAAAPPAGNVDDRTLEIFSRNLSQVSNKANEVDGINVELALLKRKVARLEEQAQLHSPMAPNGQFPPRESSIHAHQAPAPPVHQQAALQTIPSISSLASPHHSHDRRILQAPSGPVVVEYPDHRATEYRPPAPSAQSSHTLEADTPSSAVGGWTSVNQGAKRPSDANGRVDISGTPLGSPKRPKLAPLEPRLPSNESIHHGSSFEDHRELPHLRPHSTDSYPDSAQSQAQHHAGYPSTQDANPDDSWRPESQRPSHGSHSAGGSPKRGGRAGRGRSRRSGQEHELTTTTPEWERESWTGSQIGPDGYYQPMNLAGRGRGAIRRSSGGPHLTPTAQHPQGQTVVLQPGDPYAHTKKQRQKPTRNADGILIRKDGRPDMRSQSSAANLRKVHARKEEERQREWEAAQAAQSPISGEAGFTGKSAGAGQSRSESPNSQDAAEVQIKSDRIGEQDRHAQVMKQMFPRGVEESRNRIYGFGDSDTRAGPSSLSRDESRDSMHLDNTRPSTDSPSKRPTPEPVVDGHGSKASVAAIHETPQDTQMSDAAPATTQTLSAETIGSTASTSDDAEKK